MLQTLTKIFPVSIPIWLMLLANLVMAANDKLDTGDTAWMLTATALVLLMTVPGLALFMAGLSAPYLQVSLRLKRSVARPGFWKVTQAKSRPSSLESCQRLSIRQSRPR